MVKNVSGKATRSSGTSKSPPNKMPPSRVGKKPVTAYVSKDVHKQLRMLGLELEKTTQEMLTEALDDYFDRHTR